MKKVDRENIIEFKKWFIEKYGSLPGGVLRMVKYLEFVDAFLLDTADVIYCGTGKILDRDIPTKNQLLVSSIGGLFLEVQEEDESFIYYVGSPLDLVNLGGKNGNMLIEGFNYFIDTGWDPEFFKN